MGEKLGSVRMKERRGVRVMIWGKEKEGKKKGGQKDVVSLSHTLELYPIFFQKKKKMDMYPGIPIPQTYSVRVLLPKWSTHA